MYVWAIHVGMHRRQTQQQKKKTYVVHPTISTATPGQWKTHLGQRTEQAVSQKSELDEEVEIPSCCAVPHAAWPWCGATAEVRSDPESGKRCVSDFGNLSWFSFFFLLVDRGGVSCGVCGSWGRG